MEKRVQPLASPAQYPEQHNADLPAQENTQEKAHPEECASMIPGFGG